MSLHMICIQFNNQCIDDNFDYDAYDNCGDLSATVHRNFATFIFWINIVSKDMFILLLIVIVLNPIDFGRDTRVSVFFIAISFPPIIIIVDNNNNHCCSGQYFIDLVNQGLFEEPRIEKISSKQTHMHRN